MQFFAIMEALRKLLVLRAWMDFDLVMRKRLLPPIQYISKF